MLNANRIFLIGPMGAGKSTIGRLLSKELNLPFKDADREIEERCGADIPWIFDVEGEEGFRRREANIIDELTQLPRVVLATGGGAVLSETNRKHLRGRGTVIYLETPVAPAGYSLPVNWQNYREKHSGKVHYSLYQRG